jgi:hypothetical protein
MQSGDTLELPPTTRTTLDPEAVVCPVEDEPWPATAELILSALESGAHQAGGRGSNRRALSRIPHRVRGRLRLFSDAADSPPREIYTRDVHARGMGFITPHRLPLGHGGFVSFIAPDGRPRRIQCTLHRCREAAPGWFEAAVCFNREQPELSDAAR